MPTKRPKRPTGARGLSSYSRMGKTRGGRFVVVSRRLGAKNRPYSSWKADARRNERKAPSFATWKKLSGYGYDWPGVDDRGGWFFKARKHPKKNIIYGPAGLKKLLG
ncbi:MAG TPA: hypothetical protein VJ327_03220 [Patescibacteria group bacterium]|nr:hypothetical protein [Patescibacteria group bacterium]